MKRKKSAYSNLSTEELARLIARWVIDLVLVLALALFLVHMLGGQTEMTGSAMDPTLTNGDRLLIDRFPKVLKRFSRFDIVVCAPAEGGRVMIRRIAGLPGETVQIREGSVYINGEPLTLPVDTDLQTGGLASEPLTLGDDEYFLLGDHAESSLDSRFSDVGNVQGETLLGRVWFRLAPFRRIGGVR